MTQKLGTLSPFFPTLCTINSRYLIDKLQTIDKVNSPLTNSFLPLAVLGRFLQALCACAIVSAEENQKQLYYIILYLRQTFQHAQTVTLFLEAS